MEEILLAQSLDLVVDGIQQRLIALADGGGNRVLAAQGRDADSVAGVLAGKRDDLGVVVGPGHAAVLHRALGRGVGVILLQRDVRVVLGQVGLCGSAGDDDHLVIGVPAVQRRDDVGVRGNDAQCNVHVGQRKIDLLGALRRDREVGQNDIDLAGLQVLDAVGGLGGDVVHLDAQILGQTVGKVDVIALILAVFIDVAERVLVRENADVDRAVRLDFVQRAVNNTVGGCRGRGSARGGAAAAGGQRQAQGCGQGRGGQFDCFFHGDILLFSSFVFLYVFLSTKGNLWYAPRSGRLPPLAGEVARRAGRVELCHSSKCFG